MKKIILSLTILSFCFFNLVKSTHSIASKGKFIIFEGIDGAGKSSLIANIKKELIKKELDNNFFFTKEPFGTDLKDPIKEIIHTSLKNDDYMTIMMAFSIERYHHIQYYIIPQLNEGKHVITDRFYPSTLVYQGDNVEKEIIEKIYQMTNCGINIDCIFFCSIDPQEAYKRILARKDNDFLDAYYIKKIEAFSAEYKNIFSRYENVIVLDMSLPIEENTKIVLDKIFSII